MDVRDTRSRPAKVAVDTSGGDSRQRILESAARLFRSQGYAATPLRAIAAASEMQAGSLYHHFASKEQIVSEVLDIGVQRVFDAVRAAVQALPADASLAATLQCAIEAHLRALLQSHDFTSANIRIFGQVPAHVRATHGALRRCYEHFWRDLLARLQQRGEIGLDVDLQRTTFYLFGAMNWATEWYDERELGIAPLAAELAGLATHGLQPAPAPAAQREARSKRA
jgi:AcrR family transcriptional regulator